MYITYNDKPFSDFNTFYDGSELFDTPEKDVTFYSVVGRNGDLSISNDRYSNVNINVNCFIRRNFIDNYNSLMNYLLSQKGYYKLEYSQEPEIFRMAEFTKAIKPDTGAFLKYGNFTLVFNCKPQKWLKSGLEPIVYIPVGDTSTSTITNPTLMDSKPLLRVTGTGTITINDSQLTLSTNTSTTVIDCEIQDAYEGTINRNPNLTVTNGFPVLKSGDNNIIISGCTVELTPRWWRL